MNQFLIHLSLHSLKHDTPSVKCYIIKYCYKGQLLYSSDWKERKREWMIGIYSESLGQFFVCLFCFTNLLSLTTTHNLKCPLLALYPWPGEGAGHLLENYKRFPYRAIITNVTESYSSGMLNCKLKFNSQSWFTFLKKCFAKGKKANLLNLKHYYFTIKRYWIHFNRSKRGKSTERTIYLHQWKSKKWKCHGKSCCKFIRKIPQIYN